MYEALIYALVISQILILGILVCGVCEYIRLRIRLAYITSRLMTTMDEVIDEVG